MCLTQARPPYDGPSQCLVLPWVPLPQGTSHLSQVVQALSRPFTSFEVMHNLIGIYREGVIRELERESGIEGRVKWRYIWRGEWKVGETLPTRTILFITRSTLGGVIIAIFASVHGYVALPSPFLGSSSTSVTAIRPIAPFFPVAVDCKLDDSRLKFENDINYFLDILPGRK